MCGQGTKGKTLTKQERKEWEKAVKELDRAYLEAINAIQEFIVNNAKRIDGKKKKR